MNHVQILLSRLVQDGPQSGSCCLFVETENEIHAEERYELAWLGARRSVAQCGCRDADGLGEFEVLPPFLLESTTAHKLAETKVMTGTGKGGEIGSSPL